MLPRPPISTLFPYTTLFRSADVRTGSEGARNAGWPKGSGISGVEQDRPAARQSGAAAADRALWRACEVSRSDAGLGHHWRWFGNTHRGDREDSAAGSALLPSGLSDGPA